MPWNHRDDLPPGSFWTPRLILALSNDDFAFGYALIHSDGEKVHTWFWDNFEGQSCSEGCYDGIEVVGWRIAPTAKEIVLAGAFGDKAKSQ